MLGIVYKHLATSCHFLPHPQSTRSQENKNTDDTPCDSKNSNKSRDIHVTGLPALVLDAYYQSHKYTMGSHNQSLPRRNETSENLKTLSRTGRGVVSGCGLFLLDMPRGKRLFVRFFALRLFLLILVSSTPVLVYLQLLQPTHRDPVIRHHFTLSLSLSPSSSPSSLPVSLSLLPFLSRTTKPRETHYNRSPWQHMYTHLLETFIDATETTPNDIPE